MSTAELRHILAEKYVRRLHWPIVPIPPQNGKPTKAPTTKGWDQPNMWLQPGQAVSVLGPGWNVGLLLREFADVDLDSLEARKAAPIFLPPAGLRYGRTSSKSSHWLYKPNHPLPFKKFILPSATDRGDLLEFRSEAPANGEIKAVQSLIPASIHPDTGEEYVWELFEPTECAIDSLVLFHSVHLVAITAALAKLHPAFDDEHKSARDEFRLATSGVLARYLPDQGEKIFLRALEIAGDRKDRKSIYEATVTKLKSGDNRVSGVPSFVKLVGVKDANRVIAWVEEASGHKINEPPAPYVISEPEEKPAPKKEGDRWPEALEESAFYGASGELMQTVEPHTESSRAALLVQVLVCFGNMIGRTAYFTAEASQHFMNLFAVLVGTTSGGRKGSSWAQVMRFFQEADPDWVTRNVQSGLSSGEGLMYAVRDRVTKTIKQKGSDEYEEVELDSGVSDKRLMVFESEFASPLRMMGRDGNILDVVIRQAWDGTGVLRTLTKNAPVKATGAHISIIGHTTKDELCREIGATEKANGFVNRFLWVCTTRSKELPEGGRLDLAASGPLTQRLIDAAAFAKTVGEMKRDPAIKEMWRDIYHEVTTPAPGLFGAIISRGAPQIMRLACIYALLDQSAIVRAEHLQAAVAVWEYCRDSARFIFGDALGDPTADRIMGALRNAPDGLDRTAISALFGRNKNAAQIARALDLLQEHGLASYRRQHVMDNIRPTETWFAIGIDTKHTSGTNGQKDAF